MPSSDDADADGCVSATNMPCDDGACDEEENTCTSGCADMDGDGAEDEACGGDDCDDSDPNRFPSNPEVCDTEHVDEDCDPTTFGTRDIDLDGFIDRRCCNGDTCGDDCDETRRGTNPNVPEVCDGRDNDCDGSVDEDLLQMSYEDNDRDLHGNIDAPIMACPGKNGTSASTLDCDDDDTTINTPQDELIDGEDNDCDGEIDEEPADAIWYPDTDNDGYGDPSGMTQTSNRPVNGHSILAIDCDDSDPTISPRAEELCNGIDDDCNGERDFEIDTNDWEDDDNDGYPDATCAGGSTRADCDDTDPITFPMAEERCDFRDNDCDGTVDESCTMGCANDAACDDGIFCNGMETCQTGTCLPGTAVTCGVGMVCNETDGMCVTPPAMDGGTPDGGADVDAGTPDLDAGGPACQPLGTSPAAGATAVGMVQGRPFVPVDAFATYRVAAGEEGPIGTLEIVMTEYSNACAIEEANHYASDQIVLKARLVTIGGSDGPPDVGTYPFGMPTPTPGTLFTGAFFIGENGDTPECTLEGTGAFPGTQTGMLELTQSGRTLSGYFEYDESSGITVSGTFNNVSLCTNDSTEPRCCTVAEEPAPACDPIAQTGCLGACYPNPISLTTQCAAAGVVEIGESCSTASDCQPGLTCSSLIGGYCTKLCYADDDGAEECTLGPPGGPSDGDVCVAGIGIPIGVCQCIGVEVCGNATDEDCDDAMDEGCPST